MQSPAVPTMATGAAIAVWALAIAPVAIVRGSACAARRLEHVRSGLSCTCRQPSCTRARSQPRT
eukprot:7375258-Alexandrium_andersonii.AAC.1